MAVLCPREGGLRRSENFRLRLTIQPARSVCVSLRAFSLHLLALCADDDGDDDDDENTDDDAQLCPDDSAAFSAHADFRYRGILHLRRVAAVIIYIYAYLWLFGRILGVQRRQYKCNRFLPNTV